MNGKAEKIKGRVEEAAGVLTNDRRLKNRGKIDQAAGDQGSHRECDRQGHWRSKRLEQEVAIEVLVFG